MVKKDISEEDIIDLTELIEPGEAPAPAAAAGDDFEAILAEASGDSPKKVDPNESLDMSGMGGIDNLLESLDIPPQPPEGGAGGGSDDLDNALDDLLGDIPAPEPEPAPAKKDEQPPSMDADLDDILSSFDEPVAKPAAEKAAPAGLDADLDDILGAEAPRPAPGPAPAQDLDADLDDLLGDLPGAKPAARAEAPRPAPRPAPAQDLDADLDDLLGDLPGAKPAARAEAPRPAPRPAPAPGLDADLDDLFSETPAPKAAPAAKAATPAAPPPDDLDDLLADARPAPKKAPAPEIESDLDDLLAEAAPKAPPRAPKVAAVDLSDDLDAALAAPAAKKTPEPVEDFRIGPPSAHADAPAPLPAEARDAALPTQWSPEMFAGLCRNIASGGANEKLQDFSRELGAQSAHVEDMNGQLTQMAKRVMACESKLAAARARIASLEKGMEALVAFDDLLREGTSLHAGFMALIATAVGNALKNAGARAGMEELAASNKDLARRLAALESGAGADPALEKNLEKLEATVWSAEQRLEALEGKGAGAPDPELAKYVEKRDADMRSADQRLDALEKKVAELSGGAEAAKEIERLDAGMRSADQRLDALEQRVAALGDSKVMEKAAAATVARVLHEEISRLAQG